MKGSTHTTRRHGGLFYSFVVLMITCLCIPATHVVAWSTGYDASVSAFADDTMSAADAAPVEIDDLTEIAVAPNPATRTVVASVKTDALSRCGEEALELVKVSPADEAAFDGDQVEQVVRREVLVTSKDGTSLHIVEHSDLGLIPEKYASKPEQDRNTINNIKDVPWIASFGHYVPPDWLLTWMNNAADTIRNEGYTLGFLMYDLEENAGMACNVDAVFPSASTIKAPFVISLASLNLDAINQMENSMRLAITESSNEDYQALRDHFGVAALNEWFKRAGVDLPSPDRAYPDITVRDLAKLWTVNYEYFTGDAQDLRVKEWFSNPELSMIHYALGEKYATSTKGGWTDTTTHDAGIVWSGDHPYIMVIMTNMPYQFSYLTDLINALDATHNDLVSHAVSLSES